METLFTFLESHPYMTYSGAVVLFTAWVRHSFFKNSKLAPKWVTFVVGCVLALMAVLMGCISHATPTDFYLLGGSLGAAIAFDDYVLEIVMVRINRRIPRKD